MHTSTRSFAWLRVSVYCSALLLSFFSSKSFAQSPGGLSANLALWLDAGSTPCATQGCAITTWTDRSPNARVFSAAASQEGTLNLQSVNFRPGVGFLTDDLLSLAQQVYDPNQNHSIYVVLKTNNTAASNVIWSETNAGGSGKTLSYGGTYANTETGGSASGGVATTLPVLNSLEQSSGTVSTYRNGSQQNIANHNATIAPIVKSAVGGRTLDGHAFEGDIVELIVYSVSHSAGEREKVESYLALKYGIQRTGDYVLGLSNSRIWDATLNAGFNEDVFGIGRDDQSGLLIENSNSVNTGSGNGTGQNGAGNLVVRTLAASPLADEEFLVIGRNTNALSLSSTNVPASIAINYRRTLREWKAQYTTNGQVRVEFNFSGLGLFSPGVNDLKMLVDIDDDGDFTNAEIVDAVAIAANTVTFDVNIPGIPPASISSRIAFAAVLTALPVKFTSFNAVAAATGNELKWKVEETFDVDKYRVEYSTNGTSFNTIATVSHKNGTTNYSYLHATTGAGTHYYRIVGIDKNGVLTYTAVKTVRIASVRTLTVLPNPVHTQVQLKMELVKATNASLRLISIDGREVKRINTQLQRGSQTVSMNMSNLNKGIYHLQIILDDEVRTVKLLKD